MTTEPDRQSGKRGGLTANSRPEPPPVKINMPPPANNEPAMAQLERNNAINAVEDLFQRLLLRLDDNDRRYGVALDQLNQHLNELSARTRLEPPQATQSGAALDRLRGQATSLAAEVSEAGGGQRSTICANDDNPAPDFGDNRLNTNFAEVTQRLERTLAAAAPAGEFDALARRLDDIGQRLDAALAHSAPHTDLRTIENQLGVLCAGFGEARQNYARIETIEKNLADLIDWAGSNGGQSQGDRASRLDAIEKSLRALDQSSRKMESRTISTLEAMNEALHSLAASANASGQRHATLAAPSREAELPRRRESAYADENDAEVWIEERCDAANDEDLDHERTAALEAELGESIPDYQAGPEKSAGKAAAAPRTEPAPEGKDEFIAAARRAATAAAAQQTPERRSRVGRLGSHLSEAVVHEQFNDTRKPRRILYFLAAGLMLTSAGLMYARLHTQTGAPATEQPPVATPETKAP